MLHLPLAPAEKIAAIGGPAPNIEAHMQSVVQNQVRDGKTIDLSGTHFVGNPLSIGARGTVGASAVFDYSTFYENVASYPKAKLGNLSFRSCDFRKNIALHPNFQIDGNLTLSKSTFSGDVSISASLLGAFDALEISAAKSVDLSIHHSNAESTINLSNSEFLDVVTIGSVSPFGVLSAANCTFHELVSIACTSHIPKTDLTESAFPSGLSLTNIGGNVSLDRARVDGILELSGNCETLACSDATLHRVTFSEASIQKFKAISSKFSGEVSAVRTTIAALHLDGCTFEMSVGLAGSAIHVFVCNSTVFESSVDLVACTGLNDWRFKKSEIRGLCDMSVGTAADPSVGHFIVDDTEFNVVTFERRVFKGRTNLSGARFRRAPNFHQVTLHESTIFSQNLDSFGEAETQSEPAFRTLKQEAERLGYRSAQGMFFALEQRCARRNLRGFHKVISLLYDYTSQYGYHAGLPFRFLFILLAIFSAIYAIYLGGPLSLDSAIDWNVVGRGVLMSLRQTLTPFFELRSAESFSFIHFAWIFQSILSIALIAEGLLAIRWRFRRA